MTHRALVSGIIGSVCLCWAAGAFAAEPYVCDPQEDPENCDCPDDDFIDACYKISPVNLNSPDDPAKLREAAGITSSWNQEAQAWEVNIDATGLTAQGIMEVNTNGGQWASVQELHNYIGALIGQDVDDCSAATEECRFPNMLIEQVGKTTRFDSSTGAWAPTNSGSLITDAITDANGYLTIGTKSIRLIPEYDDISELFCPGIEQASYEYEKQEDLAGDQCSWARLENLGEADIHEGKKLPYLVTRARTDTEATHGGDAYFGKTLYCTGSRGPNGNLVCDITNGWIVYESRPADSISIDTAYFEGEDIPQPVIPSPEEDYDPPLTSTPGPASSFAMTATKSGITGVCSHGEAK